MSETQGKWMPGTPLEEAEKRITNLCKHLDAKDAEIQRLTDSRDMWKCRAIALDGKYQNWIE